VGNEQKLKTVGYFVNILQIRTKTKLNSLIISKSCILSLNNLMAEFNTKLHKV